MEADVDKSCTLSFEELRNYMQDEKVEAYFASLDIDAVSAEKIFALLDEKGASELPIEDFVVGCLDYRGVAKVVDIEMSKRQVSHMALRLQQLEEQLRSEGVKRWTMSQQQQISI